MEHVLNMPNFIVFAAIPAICLGKKVILDNHDSVPETYLAKFSTGRPGNLYKLLCMEERISCGIADRIICVNHPQMEALVRRGMPAGKIVVSMNVPDPRLFPKTDGKTGGDGKTIRIVYHGTITKRLGIDLAIRAVARLLKHFPPTWIIISGRDDARIRPRDPIPARGGNDPFRETDDPRRGPEAFLSIWISDRGQPARTSPRIHAVP